MTAMGQTEPRGLLRRSAPRNDRNASGIRLGRSQAQSRPRHCEERSDEAIPQSKTELRPEKFLPKAQPVIRHFYERELHNPKMRVHQHSGWEPQQISPFCF